MATTAFGRRRIAISGPAAFTILEVMIAAGILAIALGSVFALNTQVTNSVRRGVSGSYASQLIQERMEQFRRASWTDLTTNYPPVADDPADAGYDSDPPDTGDPTYVDDTYTSDFNYDLSDLGDTTAGLADLMSTPTASSVQLPNVTETVKVETYNPSSDILPAYTGDVDGLGNPVTVDLQPYQAGGTPIIVTRQADGTVTTNSDFNKLLVLSTTIRMTITVTWRGTDNMTRTKEVVTLFTVEGDK